MKKLFVSLPMRGLSEREIRKRMNYLKSLVELELKEAECTKDEIKEVERIKDKLNDMWKLHIRIE